MRQRLIRTLAVVGLLGLVAGVFKAPAAYAADRKKVVGAGSSFAYLLLDQWRADTANKPFALDFNYQASGSTQGRQQFGAGSIDFAGSDIPYQPDDPKVPAAGSYRYVTAVAGALSFMFNVIDDSGNRIENLRLNSKQVCRIFTEPTVTSTKMKWNDPQIAALNPGVVLPDKSIEPVVRADGSGTSFVLSEYCIATQPAIWQALRDYADTKNPSLNSEALKAGRPVSTWPSSNFSAAPLSTGIANTVTSTPGGITYIEAGYKDITGLPLASVDNAAGNPVAPSPSAITSALSHASVRADGTFQLDFETADPAAYLPSTYSYLIVPTTIDPGKGRTLAEYIYYGMTFGQDSAEPLAYAKLSQNLIDDAIKTAEQLSGATPFADWKKAVGLTAGGGNTSGGNTSGGNTSGGNTSGGNTSGGNTSGGNTSGGNTSGGNTSGGDTSGGDTSGGNTSGGDTGGGNTGGGDTSGGNTTSGVTTAPGAATNSGSVVASKVLANQSVATVAGKPGVTVAKKTTAAGQTAAAAPAAAAPVASRKAPGPSNADYVWVAFQGAALVGVGWAVVKMRGSMA
jgi:phosphate transport system substrate-binding protein